MSVSPSPRPPTGDAADPQPHVSPPAGAPFSARDRREPRWERTWLDAALSGVLGVLVAGSLVLTGRLWLTNPYLTPPPQPPGAYVAADASGRAIPADLLAPLRIVLHSPDGNVRGLADPGNPVFKAIWTASRRLLTQIGPNAVSGAHTSDVAALADAAEAGPSVELWFGARLSWLDLRAVLLQGAGGAGGPRVDRVLIQPGARSTAVYLAAGTSVRRISLPAAAAHSLVDELGALPRAGNPLRPLDPLGGSVRVLPGVFVPLGVPPPVGVSLEPLNVHALIDVSFRDPSVVRTAIESNGSRFFTDGADWLRVSRDGAAHWAAPEVATPLHGGWVAALSQAVRFVDHRGGWPASATLVGVGSSSEPGVASGAGARSSPAVYRLSFAVRYQGWEVIGRPPAVSVSVGATGVTSYVRRVPVAAGVQPASSGITAELGLQSLAASWPSGVLPSERVVEDAFTCYVYQGGRQLIPAWDYQLADGSQIAVDALSGRVLGLVSPPA